MKRIYLFTFLYVFTFMPIFLNAQVNEQDSLALVDFYNKLGGEDWASSYSYGWLTNTSLNRWYGITTANNRVTEINFKSAPTRFSGAIPSSIGDLTALEMLIIRSNYLTGGIPPEIGKLKALTYLNLSNGLTGNIPPEIGNLTELNNLSLSNNEFTGSIPSGIGTLTKLSTLNLSKNDLTGSIPSGIANMKDLKYLYLFDNKLDNITKLPKSLEYLYLESNKFDFDDLEPLSNISFVEFKYDGQENITVENNLVNGANELSMDAGGTQTTYQWFYKNAEITGATSNKYIVPPGKEVLKHHCEAKNSLLPNLTIKGIPTEDVGKACWRTGQLAFCLNSGKWEKASGNNIIKTSNIISINDFLFFDGTMTIDTSKLEIEADGEFYVDNIPLAKDLGIGKYTLAEGKYKLNLLGNDKKITNFLNSELSKTAVIFGTPIKIDDLQLFNRNDTIGVKINSSVKIPLLSSGCGIPGVYKPETDLKLKNLEVTNKGILSAGIQVENLGFFSQGCLKNASLEYDWKKDVLTGGAEVSVSYFGDVGAGVKIENGNIDSVAWKIDSNLPPIPIYGTFSAKGFYGHFAGLNNYDQFNQINLNNLDIKIGGIFTDFISKYIYQLDMDGRIKLSGLLEASGTVQSLQPPFGDLPYQIKGTGNMAWDYSNKQLKFGFDGKFGTMNGEEWLGDADGEFSVDYRDDLPKASAHFSGDLTIPELSDEWPLNWISNASIGTTNIIFSENPNLVHGIMYYYITAENLFKVPYIIDITKNWYNSGYIQFPSISRIYFDVVEEKSGLIANVSKTFTVPENNQFGVIEIKSETNAPASSITSPSGEKYSISTPEDNVLYTETDDKKEAFWSLLSAKPGDWIITLENPSQDDSIITHFQLKEKDFNFSMNQTGKTVTVNWDVAQVEEGQTVNIMLDDNDADFDGFLVQDGDATKGSLSFILDESTPNCNYYLFVQLVDEYSVVQSYADNVIENPLATLAPPENLSSEYNTETGEFNFTWTENPTSEITGYILSVTDELGNDSVYAILNSNQTSISLFIEDFETKSAKIESYNQDWKIGCPTTALALSTSLDEHYELEEPDNKLNIFPNPTTGNLTIRYYVSENSNCEIRIFDIQGRQIAQPLAEYRTAGFHQLNFNYERVPNGLYIIKFINDYQTFTVKSILSK